ncbi:hypothetical protein [Pseudobacteriovorax antillogorgiicola]|uniref:Uncharacterized protein n=1 Tax=Pseudobacteriovorax antillogorgiicola TaxID=1513793 RepID=A0A1Y6BI74_9BACT|nr:hypothetical protein [Pseudobacteriovorax antillogorgiicola]TCS56195.1 hypothetical protein EDD56_10417 [Pseudobacteriovorax antillogorgiicola]SMF08743.1 hypothetical protein SAMN06296036_104317 [Pseudobacteriovorax antillogorgiicola]
MIFLILWEVIFFCSKAHAQTPDLNSLKTVVDRSRLSSRGLLSDPGVQGLPIRVGQHELQFLGSYAVAELKHQEEVFDSISGEDVTLTQELQQTFESQWITYRYGWEHLFLAMAIGRNQSYQYHSQAVYYEENRTRIDENGFKIAFGHGQRIGGKKISLIAYQVHFDYGQISQVDRGPRYGQDLDSEQINSGFGRIGAGIDVLGRLYFAESFGIELSLRSLQSQFEEAKGDSELSELSQERIQVRRDMLINGEDFPIHWDMALIVALPSFHITVRGLSSLAPYSLAAESQFTSSHVALELGVIL